MPFNVLFLPLLGGYFFITNWNRTKFLAIRLQGHHLIFQSAFAGLIFLAISLLLSALWGVIWPTSEYLDWVNGQWKQYVPFPHSGIAGLALVLGVTSACLGNKLQRFDKSRCAFKAIQENGNPLEMLFSRALNKKKLVSITLKNSKVYVGFVWKLPDPTAKFEGVRLIPVLSGYRKNESRELVITTHYYSFVEPIIKDMPKGADAIEQGLDVELVLPIDSIYSASYFDLVAYVKHFLQG